MSERDTRLTLEEVMLLGPKSTHFHIVIIEYLYGRREKPIKLIQSGIQFANNEIKNINSAISDLGFCLFGEKRIERQRLVKEKNRWKQHILVLYEVLELRSNLDIVGVAALLEKYENLTHFSLR